MDRRQRHESHSESGASDAPHALRVAIDFVSEQWSPSLRTPLGLAAVCLVFVCLKLINRKELTAVYQLRATSICPIDFNRNYVSSSESLKGL